MKLITKCCFNICPFGECIPLNCLKGPLLSRVRVWWQQSPFVFHQHTQSTHLRTSIGFVFSLFYHVVSSILSQDRSCGWKENVVSTETCDIGIWSHLCHYLCPPELHEPKFWMYHFHHTVNCCCYLILWLGGYAYIHFVMSTSGCIATWYFFLRSFLSYGQGTVTF